MMYDALIHCVRVKIIEIVNLINDDGVKSALADFLLVTDAVTHGLWTSEYNEWLNFLGLNGSSVDAAMASLAFVRLSILLNERAIKR